MQRYVNMRLARQIKGRSVDFVYLSDHPDLTLEVIKSFPDAHWDWESIQCHDSMCLRWLVELQHAPWDWIMLPDIDAWTFDWVKRLPDSPWQWSTLHHHRDFELSWVEQFPNKPWNMHEISASATIKDLHRPVPWVWAVVTYASPVTTAEMAMYPNLPWDFSELAFEHVTMDDVPFLYTFKDKLDWSHISEEADWEVVRAHPDLPWDWYQIEPEGFVEDDMKIIRAHDPSVFNWKTLSITVPFSVIIANTDLPWRSDWVSMNDSLTFNDLPGPFNWDYSFVPCEPVEDLVRKWRAANLIKRRFKEAISDPDFLLCRNRLLREGEELSQIQNQ